MGLAGNRTGVETTDQPRIDYGPTSFSPDSRWLTTVDHEAGAAVLWDLQASSTAPHELDECDDANSIPTYSTNSKWLGCTDKAGNTFVWDLKTPLDEPKRLRGGDALASQLYFSPNELWLIALRNDHGLNVWSLEDDPTLRILRSHDSHISEVQFLDDKHTLVTVSNDGELRRWDLQSISAIPVQLQGHDESVVALAFDETGTGIVSLGSEAEAFKWDLEQHDTYPESLSMLGFPGGSSSQYPSATISRQGRLLAMSNFRTIFFRDLQELWVLAV